MRTRYTTRPELAAQFIRRGNIVAFPTETVYGLGADAFNPRAVRAIFEAKGRPSDNPLIVHIADRAELDLLVVRDVPAVAARLMDAFWPGPLTLILRRRPDVPDAVTAGLDTVGVRLPSHPIARAFLRAAGTPVAAPSANQSGRPSPTTWQAVKEDLHGRIACVLKGGRARVGLESSVVDCTGRTPVVLRAGAISIEDLKAVVPTTRDATARDRAGGRSPGLKHRHYAPRVRVILVKQTPAELQPGECWIGLAEPPAGGLKMLRCRNTTAYAREVFHFFRACERAGASIIYCEAVPQVGIGRALMDRLRRAASATSGEGARLG